MAPKSLVTKCYPWGVRMDQEALRWLKRRQNGLKEAPTSKRSPETPQHGHGPKRTQDGCKGSQHDPKMGQNGCKGTQSGPKMGKKASSRLQKLSKDPQGCSNRSQDGVYSHQFEPKMSQYGSQENQSGHQMAFR